MTQLSILSRRSLLAGGTGLMLATGMGMASFAAGPASDAKLVVIILRGGMDGLAAVAPVGDAAYRSLRGPLALGEPGAAGGTLALTGPFGMHPALTGLKGLWDSGQLSILHATATPYRDRSHFEAQDALEGGMGRAYATDQGWLNRAIGLLPAGPSREGIGIGRTVPLILRGPAKASSWAPAMAPETDADTLNRLADLYAYDPLLGPALAKAVETDALLADSAMPDMAGGRGAGRAFGYAPLAASAAKLLVAENGPGAAVLSFDGWDTHANQGTSDGQLANRLRALDAAITTLRTDLGPVWDRTVVVIATEFGRTARINGTGGTDHGTGGVAFVTGGGVRGGQMLGEWPGLATLHQDRDLAAPNDLRALFAGVLAEHWKLDRATLTDTVFPGLGAPLRGVMA